MEKLIKRYENLMENLKNENKNLEIKYLKEIDEKVKI